MAMSPRVAQRSTAEIPVRLEAAAGRVAAGADVLLAERQRDLAVRLEGGDRGIRQRARDGAVVALRVQAVRVQDRPDLRRRDLAAEDRRALVVAGELDRLVALRRERRQHLREPVRDAGRVRRRRDAVALRVQDRADVLLRHPGRVVAPDRPRRGPRERRGRACCTCRRAEELATTEVELLLHLEPPFRPLRGDEQGRRAARGAPPCRESTAYPRRRRRTRPS